jgi:hypothetical protein
MKNGFIIIGIIVIITLVGAYFGGYYMGSQQITKQYQVEGASFWNIPYKQILLSYRAEGTVLQTGDQWSLKTSDGNSVSFANPGALNVTQVHALTAADAPNWRSVSAQTIAPGDHLIVTLYHNQTNANYPVTIYLVK